VSLHRRLAVLVAASIVALALALASLAGRADNPTLIGFVGTNDGFDIGLTDANGTPVTRVPPGTYTFLVRDRSRIHNFHFASNEDRTVDFRTDLEFVGETSFTVTLKEDVQYAYACEPHWQTMNGSLLSTNRPAPSPPPPAPPPPAQKPKTLRAGVTAGGTAHVGSRSVKAGRYRVVVTDASKRRNFHLAGPGVNRRTGAAFTGTTTWTLRLTRGTYRFGSDPEPLEGRLRVR
jgi:Copper binding proteins, plastocyanin/azurin family